MKILIYSQHVLGIGHFFRSMEIARAMDRHEVLFAEGGDPLPGFVPPPHVKRLILPPLMMDKDFKAIQVREGALDQIKQERTRILRNAFDEFAPDVFMTELFPFGRKQFRFELIPLLESVQNRRKPVRVVCSLRDILVEKNDQAGYEQGVLKVLNSHFDLLLIHSDPRVTRLEETFERAAEIIPPTRYTGFVVRRPGPRRVERRGKLVVASSGGGNVGDDLLASTIEAVRRLPGEDLRLKVFIGPFMEEDQLRRLKSLAAPDARTSLEPFSSDFQSELAAADLSISMAGYNTCMDILGTGIKALVHPFPQNREQSMRARKLQELGVLQVIPDLNVKSLSVAIRDALNASSSRPSPAVDLSGAEKTALLVEEFCGAR